MLGNGNTRILFEFEVSQVTLVCLLLPPIISYKDSHSLSCKYGRKKGKKEWVREGAGKGRETGKERGVPRVCGNSNLNLRETGILLTFALGARSQAAARMGRESKHSAWDRRGLSWRLHCVAAEVSVICDVLHI